MTILQKETKLDNLSAKVTRSYASEFRRVCDENMTTPSQVLRRLSEQWLEKQKASRP